MRRTDSELSRRQLLAGAAASLGAAGFPATPSILSARPRKRVIVLVHGAWHGGWCWRRVADRLTAKGHYVVAPTLTGVGERSHLASDAVSLTTQINDVVNDITWKDLDDVVLVGHSYGGMVITGVAEQVRERIAAIAYLDAFIPADGQSLAALRAPGAKPFATPLVPAPPASYFKVNPKDVAWVGSKLTAHPTACFTEPLHVTDAYRSIRRKAYVRSRAFAQPAFDANYTRWRADPDWQTSELDCGHDVMIDRPDEVTTIIERLT